MVKGPASAMVASCHRLGWTVISSTELRTDLGETPDLLLDSPAAVKLEVARAVQRWRWRNLEVQMPQLKKGGSGAGAFMEPITKLLKSKANNEDWNPALRGSLRSVIAGRQYPQARVFAAGWAVHNKCLFCLHKLVSLGSRTTRRTRINGKTRQHEATRTDKAKHKVEATAEQIAEAPVGSLGHRIWKCQAGWMSKQRNKWAAPRDLEMTSQCNTEGHPAWGRALQPRPSKPKLSAASEASFKWVVEPEGGMIEGTAYSDGSFLDGPIPELARGGWAFAVLSDNGTIVASAHGVPPPWIKDIGGAEVWGVLQVGLRAVPGKVKFMIDCQPCVYMIHGGVTAATTADRPLARVNAMVMSVLEDTPTEKVVWMPAHKSKQSAGLFRCSNGELITEWDIRGNAEADRLAKLAVRQHRVDPAEVKYWERLCNETLETAKWIARATWAASNCDEAPFRDTEASQWRAEVFRKDAKDKKAAAAAAAADDPEQEVGGSVFNLRGHNPVKALQLSSIRSGWRCTICRKTSSKRKLLTISRCMGCPLVKWSRIEIDDDEAQPSKPTQVHKRMQSGSVMWCYRCGVYADKQCKGLSKTCNSTPPKHRHRGGMEGQLRKLRNCIHPKTGAWLPKAFELDPVVLPAKVNSEGPDKVMPDGFYLYEPVVTPPAVASESTSGSTRWKELQARIRAKELANTTVAGRDNDAGREESQLLIPLTESDLGGGVWECLFPGEIQHPISVGRLSVAGKCKGRYRIKTKGAACHGSACCEVA